MSNMLIIRSDRERNLMLDWYADIQNLCDFRLQTDDGGEFNVHRLILWHVSPYFEMLVRNSKRDDTVLLSGIDKSTLHEVLQFIYLKSEAITSQNVTSILAVADYFLMDGLVEKCIKHMTCNINVENSVPFYVTATILTHLPNVEDRCYQFIKTNFEWVVHECDDFHLLPYDSLVKFLSHDTISVSGEDTVWDAVVKWTDGQGEQRLEKVYDLINCLRFTDLTADYINDVIFSHNIVRNNIHFQAKMETIVQNSTESYTDELLKKQSISDGNRRIVRKETSGRKPNVLHFFARREESKGVYFGEWKDDYCTIYEMYDSEFDSWRKVGKIEDFCLDFMFAVGDMLYLFDSDRDLRCSVSILDGSSQNLPITPIRRTLYNVVCLNNSIYVIGGTDYDGDFMSCRLVERFDTDSQEWIQLPSLDYDVRGSTDVLDGKIYVIGDYFDHSNDELVLRCDCYDPETNEWTSLSKPNCFRYNFAMTSHKGCLYLIGGKNLGTPVTTVEKFDPLLDEWTMLNDLPHGFEQSKAIVLDDILIVFDNMIDGRDLHSCNDAVFWNEDTMSWYMAENWNHEILYHFVCAKIVDQDTIDIIRPRASAKFYWNPLERV